MARARMLMISLGLAVAFVLGSPRDPTEARAQRRQPGATPPTVPQFLAWPLPVTAKTYGTIDGKHLWQYVKEQAEIAEHYRDQGHPQFWGRIAGTSSDIEDVDWLMKNAPVRLWQ